MTGLGIASDALPLLAGLTTLGAVLLGLAAWLGRWRLWLAGYALIVLALATAFFFRDPDRPGERGPSVFLSPADGRVVGVERVHEPRYVRGEAIRVAIYLGLLDVHVQRSPVGGVVDRMEHSPGRFAPAWSDRAAENEATAIRISAGEQRVLVRQVAGTIARRIVTYVQEGQQVEQSERIGLIRFGSRVEVYLPAHADVVVSEGDRVRAGSTVIARLPRPATRRAP